MFTQLRWAELTILLIFLANFPKLPNLQNPTKKKNLLSVLKLKLQNFISFWNILTTQFEALGVKSELLGRLVKVGKGFPENSTVILCSVVISILTQHTGDQGLK